MVNFATIVFAVAFGHDGDTSTEIELLLTMQNTKIQFPLTKKHPLSATVLHLIVIYYGERDNTTAGQTYLSWQSATVLFGA